MWTTRISRHIGAPRAAVYRALINSAAVAHWMVPDNMSALVHAWDARVGGRFRVSLTYDAPTETGKTSANTDTYNGQFVALIPNEKVVQTQQFETANPDMRGEMTSTITLTDAPSGGTLIDAVHQHVPPGLRPEDNQIGWRMALDKLAALLEAR